jgi:hypothetical protein
MRIQLCIPEDLAPRLVELALHDNRSTRQQAEWLLWQAIEQAAQQSQPQPQEAPCATD